jgi:hypothetical protein
MRAPRHVAASPRSFRELATFPEILLPKESRVTLAEGVNCETCEQEEEGDDCSAESATGMGASSVGKLFGVNKSTVRYIKSTEQRTGEFDTRSSPGINKVTSVPQDKDV